MPLAAIPAVYFAAAGLAVAAYGAYTQYEAAGDAAHAAGQASAAQQRQAQLEQRRADIQNARQLRSAVRQARIARASVLNQGANAGTSFSSGVLGGVDSVTAQERSNVGFFNQMTELQGDVTQAKIAEGTAMAGVSEAQADGNRAAAIGSLGGTIFSAAGGYKTIFGGNKKTTT